ncbi:MAG: GNAT family N-acetyltransferase [Betaproteobacteria bacterium]
MSANRQERKSSKPERVSPGVIPANDTVNRSPGRRTNARPAESAGKTIVSRASIVDIPAVFLTLHAAARDGFFSTWLCDPKSQGRLLLMLFWIVLLGRAYPSLHRKHRATLRIATRNGIVVGHTVLLSQDSGMEIFTCAVSAGYRRMGVGRRLVADAVAQAGQARTQAACMPKAHAMCMLLRDVGFVETGRHLPGAGANVVLRHWQFSSPPVNAPATRVHHLQPFSDTVSSISGTTAASPSPE